MNLANRVEQLTPSLTLAIAAKAKALKAEGIDICGFGAGEPDFDTPKHICDAAIKALQEGKTRYGPVAGLPPLREAIAQKLSSDNALPFSAENIIVCNGGKQTLFNLAMAFLSPGDEVILPAPYWLSYPEMVTLAGAKSVVVKTNEATGFKITPEQLKAAITPRTKLLVLTSPSNPTGAVYSKAELEAIAKIIVDNDIYVVSDEIYEKLVYGDTIHTSIGSLGDEIFSRTIISAGFAKAYAMTGWRVGYLAGPVPLIKAVAAIQSHSTSNVCTFSQYGALAALTSKESEAAVATMRSTFEKRLEVMHSGLTSIPGITCVKPQGAFYMFPNISGTGLSSLEFCDRLLDSQNVAAVPGVAFGAEGHIRMSYATDLGTITKGLDRIQKFVASL